MRWRVVFVAYLWLNALVQPLEAQSFIGLGSLPEQSARYQSSVLGASEDGKTIVGQTRVLDASGNDYTAAFRWDPHNGIRRLEALGSGERYTSAWGINADATIIAGYSENDDGESQAVYWDAQGNVHSLGPVTSDPSEVSLATGITPDGSVITGTFVNSTGSGGFRWTADAGMELLSPGPNGTGDFSAYPQVIPFGVNQSGTMTYGFLQLDGETVRQPYYWTEETGIVLLGDLDSQPETAWGAIYASSGDGVVDPSQAGSGGSGGGNDGGSGNSGGGDGSDSDDDSGGDGSGTGGSGNDGSGDNSGDSGDNPGDAGGSSGNEEIVLNNEPIGPGTGAVLVGYTSSDNGREAFKWDEVNGMVGLGDLPGGSFSSDATGITADGTFIVGSSDVGLDFGSNRLLNFDRNSIAFIWDEANGMRPLKDYLEETYNLDLSDWILFDVSYMNSDGSVISGFGSYQGEIQSYSFSATTIPEPSTGALILLTALGAAWARRR